MDAGVRPSPAQPLGQPAGPTAKVDHRSRVLGPDPVDKVEEWPGALVAVMQVLGGIPSHDRIVPPNDGGAALGPRQDLTSPDKTKTPDGCQVGGPAAVRGH